MDIKGYVFDEKRAPVASASVTVYTAAAGTPGTSEGTATTDANGMYSVTGLAAGNKDVKVDKTGIGYWMKGLVSHAIDKLWLGTFLGLVQQSSAPAAPGASQTVLYSKTNGMMYKRFGASGDDEPLTPFSVWIPADELVNTAYTPADDAVVANLQLTTGNYGGKAAKFVDAATKEARFILFVPAWARNYANIRVSILTVVPATPAATTVRLILTARKVDPPNTWSAAIINSTATHTVGTTLDDFTTLEITAAPGAIGATNELLTFILQRTGGHVDDTYNQDLYILGVQVELY